jgi:hypothetical protein
MNTLLWLGQALLALVFAYSGICKSIYSREKLMTKGQTGVATLSIPQIRFIGLTEILGVIGIILPWWLNILPILTPVTAICFGIIMLLAVPVHYKRKEPQNVLTNIILLLISLFVANGRLAY